MNETNRPIRFPEALDVEGNRIHIDKAPRGRKGYRCTGCKKDVEAIKPIGNKPRPYFRHVAKDVDISKSECTYASETYRHKLAKEALQEEKSIRVPRVLKYPPKGIDSDPRVVAGPRTITAYRVDIEKSFYVNNQGLLKYGPKRDESIVEPDKHFLIVPDVIFFDRNDKPILFIELVATHDLDDIKLAKIRALKIDTVRVRLPIESAEAIRECFKITERTKWIYNNERERADYFELPRSTTERISGADRYEAGLSGESTRCRKSRIGNLIRGIRRGLEANGFGELQKSLKEKSLKLKESFPTEKELRAKLTLNHIKVLEDEERKFATDKQSLKELANGWKSVIKYLEDKLNFEGPDGLERDEERLRTKKSGLKDYIQKSASDMKEREKLWKAKKVSLMGSLKVARLSQELMDESSSELNSKLKEKSKELETQSLALKEISQLLEEKWKPFKEILSEKEANLKQTFESKQTNWIETLSNLKNERMTLFNNLQKKQQSYQEELILLEQKSENDLKSLKEKLLTQLKEDILKETPNCPDKLKNWFLLGEYSRITHLHSNLLKDMKKRLDTLTLRLSKHGLTPEEILVQIQNK